MPVVGLSSPRLSARPSPPTSSTASPRSLITESASQKKLGILSDKYDVYSELSNVNIVVDIGILSDALCKTLKCSPCN